MSVLGIGNPLLDISANVPQEVLDKWGAKLDNAILAEEKHVPLYDDLVEHFDVEYIAGGATQNSIRICAKLLGGESGNCAYFGCIGEDKYGKQLSTAAKAAGVNPVYQVDKEAQTGTCAVLVKDSERSLIANLSAANKFTPEHLDTKDAKEALEASKFIYSSGFFLTVSPPALMTIAKHALKEKKSLMLNLAAPFICTVPPFKKAMYEVMPYCDVVFGNESEAEAFAEAAELEKKDAVSVAEHISGMNKLDDSRPRICIITQGSEFTAVSIGGKTATKYDVTPIDKKLIVDSNGAGDAFVGGFLALYKQGKSLKECVEAGHYTAGLVIQESGAKLPTSAIGKYKAEESSDSKVE